MRLALVALAAALATAAAPAAETTARNAAQQVIAEFGLEQAATPVRQRAGWRKPKRILVDPSSMSRAVAAW